jgi:hypothetical protein
LLPGCAGQETVTCTRLNPENSYLQANPWRGIADLSLEADFQTSPLSSQSLVIKQAYT